MDKNQKEALEITKKIEIEIKKMIKSLKKDKLSDEKFADKLNEIYYALGHVYLRTVLDNSNQ